MSKSIDLDRALTHVKYIVDSNRCGTCDKLEDLRRRCACGCVVCANCASEEEECVACGILPDTSTNKPIIDKSLTQKVQNAQILMSTFADAFKIDVNRRHRISEKLKIEKNIFPDCIQAPMKYSNKRKSFDNLDHKNKENRDPKMKKTKYVQQWINDNNKTSSSRMPFSNIFGNDQSSTISRTKHVNKAKVKSNKKTNIKLKRTTNKLTHDNHGSNNKNEFPIGKYLKIVEKNKVSPESKGEVCQSHVPNKIQDESGIGLDDTCIVIEDTPTEHIDKDELACQAVLRAELHDHSDYASFVEDAEDISKKMDNDMKVPFIQKSSLYKTCVDSNDDLINVNSDKDLEYSKNTKNNSNGITITIVHKKKGNENVKQSTSAQTDLSEIVKFKNLSSNCSTNKRLEDSIIFTHQGTNKIPKSSMDVEKHTHEEANNIPEDSIDALESFESQDIFLEEGLDLKSSTFTSQKYLGDHGSEPNKSLLQNRSKHLIIDESESDNDLEPKSLRVTVEVHRSSQPEDKDVLTDLPLMGWSSRKRQAVRGATPDSNNSSEKENLNPNRMKKSKCVKKKRKKDKAKYKI